MAVRISSTHLGKGQSLDIVFLGIDLAKNVFALHGVDARGRAALARPLVRQDQLLEMVEKLSPCTIEMERVPGRTTERARS